MKTGKRGLALIKSFEKFSPVVYDPIAGDGRPEPTIGYGHLLKPGEKFDGPISEEVALQLLAADLEEAERGVSEFIVTARQSEFDALVSFVFNLGADELGRSTLRRLHSEGRRLDVARQFQRFDRSGGRPLRGLLRRRLLEAALFLEDR